ncbi:hypothetical protein M2138_000382 [Dysgonomonadaceae bacterium PH5-43]|nr:hypothetical protein [Dysgonomonadaceae bacterium PH5-43]
MKKKILYSLLFILGITMNSFAVDNDHYKIVPANLGEEISVTGRVADLAISGQPGTKTYGSWQNINNNLHYTPKLNGGAGYDYQDGLVTFLWLSWSHRAHAVVVNPDIEIAEPGSTITLKMQNVTGLPSEYTVTYNWYKIDQTTPISTSYTLSNEITPEYVVVEAVLKQGTATHHSIKFPVMINKKLAGCATTGSVLYLEDFGADDTNTIWKPSGIAACAYTYYNGNPSAANLGMPYLDEKRYIITKKGEPHRRKSGQYRDGDTNGWAQIEDRTDPGRGYFLLANASTGTDILYTTDISNLCDGSSATYFFSAWIANVLSPGNSQQDPVNFRFVLCNPDNENEVYKVYETGNILNHTNGDYSNDEINGARDNNNWRQYGFEFSLLGRAKARLIIRNNRTGSNGNDFALDDIEIRYCESSNQATVNILNPGAILCHDTDIKARYTTNASGTVYYKWIHSQNGFIDDNLTTWSVVGSEQSTALTQSSGSWTSDMSITPPTDGYYRLVVSTTPNFDFRNKCLVKSDAIRCSITRGNPVFHWTGSANNNWNNPANWYQEGVTPNDAVPGICAVVHIPGNVSKYPRLESPYTVGNAVCKDIYFHFGAEVGRSDLLTYERAFVHYNFGTTNGNPATWVDGESAPEPINADAYAADPMLRERWYALAAPLKSMLSGDFAIAGKPFFWQRKFEAVQTEGNSHIGSWAEHTTSEVETFIADMQNAIAVYAAGHYAEYLGFEDQSDLDAVNGILYMPYFMDDDNTHRHRLSAWNSNTKANTIHYFHSDRAGLPKNENKHITVTRGYEAYRFIFEDNNATPVEKYTIAVPAGQYTMVGNPFLSSLDFHTFYEDNKDVLMDDAYRIAVNDDFLSYSREAGSQHITELIAPLQAFHIHTNGNLGETVNIEFNYTQSTTRCSKTLNKHQLRGSVSNFVDDVLYISSSNDNGSSHLTLSFQNVDAKNSSLLTMEDSATPIVYAVDGDYNRNTIQFEGYYLGRAIPVGIKSDAAETVTLAFSNVEGLQTDTLVLLDKYLNEEINLMETDSYTFENVPTVNDRFEIRYAYRSEVGIRNVEESFLTVSAHRNTVSVSSSGNNKIKEVSVIDIQGRVVKSVSGRDKTLLSFDVPYGNGVVIVKVKAENGTAARKVLLQ